MYVHKSTEERVVRDAMKIWIDQPANRDPEKLAEIYRLSLADMEETHTLLSRDDLIKIANEVLAEVA